VRNAQSWCSQIGAVSTLPAIKADLSCSSTAENGPVASSQQVSLSPKATRRSAGTAQ
jgi:hypothetical protein